MTVVLVSDWPYSDQRTWRGEQMLPTANLREAFERSGLTRSEVARRLGWYVPHVQRFNRVLGYCPDSNSHGVRVGPRRFVTYKVALAVCEAIGCDPVDVGV